MMASPLKVQLLKSAESCRAGNKTRMGITCKKKDQNGYNMFVILTLVMVALPRVAEAMQVIQPSGIDKPCFGPGDGAALSMMVRPYLSMVRPMVRPLFLRLLMYSCLSSYLIGYLASE